MSASKKQHIFNEKISNFLQENDVLKKDIFFVDITDIDKNQTLGFPFAVLFLMPLSKQFLKDFEKDPMTEDEFTKKELAADELADKLSAFIVALGQKAFSQSEKNSLLHSFSEKAYFDPDMVSGICALPNKTLGRLAGAGFIGKNNLLVTDDYGCAFSMCSVLTDAPLETPHFVPHPAMCGGCTVCIDACPANALTGKAWFEGIKRDDIVDVSKCFCALTCMVSCPFTKKYRDQVL